jgi:tetratricopeptide (TPR) repeat protein
MNLLKSRRILVLSIAGVVLAVAIVTAIIIANDPYRGLETERGNSVDEQTQEVVGRRLDLSLAALDAQKKDGGDIDLDLYNSIALDAWTLGDLVLAREISEEYFTHNNQNYGAWNHYGNILNAMGDKEGAEAAYLRTIEVAPNVEEYYRDYMNIVAEDPERDEEVKAILEVAIAATGQTSWNMVTLGNWYEEHGECDRAIDHYEVAADLAPENENIALDLEELRATCSE